MRHFLLAHTITAGTGGVIEAANSTGLVTPASFTHARRSDLFTAMSGAIDLTTIAVGADQHLDPAMRAKKESTRCFHR
ncbi:MAG: hypothetical protein Q7R66_07170 [Undibacterium sp.]|uniref:hypothetical protein n=1 Tax=Undibacterium sp. TaxID=1914977 RepID=UPI0027191CBC|nr:hypothetical protein [Undibacterium sp.]MDO8651951.1 hypothetical protein [Undibacterium sp.]